MKTKLLNWFAALLITAVCLPPAGFALSLLPPPDFPLLEAVKKGDVQEVRSILASPAFNKRDIDDRGTTGDFPLVVAARRGNLEIVKLLIEHGAETDVGKKDGERTPLLEAAAGGYTDIARYLISKGADVNARGKGLTPLLAACAGGVNFGPPGDKPKTIRILLENGADVNVQDESWLKSGRTPLMYAVLRGDAELVQALLDKGARLDLKNKDGDTALSLAGKEGLEYITQLLENPAGRNAKANADPERTPLLKAVRKGRLDKVKALIDRGADVNLRTPSGSTPLMYAADRGKPDIVRFLLKRGADVNAKNGTNNTALIFASIKGNIEAAKELLKYKADVNVKNLSKGDALIFAVLNKKPEMVRVLLKAGARVGEKYDEGKTALIMAAEEGSTDIVKLLITGKADVNAADQNGVTALMIACEKGHAGMAEALLNAGADFNKKSKYGDTALGNAIAGENERIIIMLAGKIGTSDRHDALFQAVGVGNLEVIRLLLTRDTDVNMPGYAGGTLLMRAAEGDISVVQFLVEKGADVNKKNDAGETALMKAVGSFHEKNISSVKYLVEHGADVNAINGKGETALIQAAKRGRADIAGILIEKGSNLSVKDKERKSAWTYAVEGGKTDIASLLEKSGSTRDYLGMEWEGNVSTQKEKFVKIVDDPREWSDLWRRAFEKPAPMIDFENFSVACVFLGHSARWLYSISISGPVMKGGQAVIEYALHDVMLRLSGPFKAGGQYHMKVIEKKKGVKMTIREAQGFSGR